MRATRQARIWALAATLLLAGGCDRDAAEEAAGKRDPIAKDGGGGQTAPGVEPASIGSPADLLPNGSQPLPDLVTGGQPSLAQLAAARDAGYLTVINLRPDSEPGAKRQEVEGLGLDYVSIPVAGKSGLTKEKAIELAWALEEATSPVLLHCGSGNRVGALLALQAYYNENENPEAALELGLSAGLTSLEPEVRRILGL